MADSEGNEKGTRTTWEQMYDEAGKPMKLDRFRLAQVPCWVVYMVTDKQVDLAPVLGFREGLTDWILVPIIQGPDLGPEMYQVINDTRWRPYEVIYSDAGKAITLAMRNVLECMHEQWDMPSTPPLTKSLFQTLCTPRLIRKLNW